TDTGDLPYYGDSDDARGFLISANDSPLAVVLELGAALTRDRELLRGLREPTRAARVLVPADAASEEELNSLRSGSKTQEALICADGGWAIVEASGYRVLM